LARSPSQPWPAAARSGATLRISGMAPGPTQKRPPPVAPTAADSFSSVARTSDISIGLSAPAAASAELVPSVMR
jgi:hypothetical protein